MGNSSVLKKYGYFWVTFALFALSLTGHWFAAWLSYIDEQREHNQPVEVQQYITETTRDTLENWQSEFLQLIWQVAGLSFLWYMGSPQSKENSERLEEKVDALLKGTVRGKDGEKIIKALDKKYPRA